jgi:hypothetical protein
VFDGTVDGFRFGRPFPRDVVMQATERTVGMEEVEVDASVAIYESGLLSGLSKD